ncbi:hypothetical protein EDD17DRAFT_1511840 [Pisolithus thermaeus]|nr:hypothetical protein EDD17DRAFT_1511840 [Pisolithus thermaeus]
MLLTSATPDVARAQARQAHRGREPSEVIKWKWYTSFRHTTEDFVSGYWLLFASRLAFATARLVVAANLICPCPSYLPNLVSYIIRDRGFFLQHPSFGRTRRLTRRIQGPFPGICSYDPHGFYYWISRAFVSERRHLESRLLVVPGHITRSFVGVWPLVPLFAAVAFHEMDNYPNRVAILRWTAAFEPSLFYWGLLLIPPGYYIDDDGDFVVY